MPTRATRRGLLSLVALIGALNAAWALPRRLSVAGLAVAVSVAGLAPARAQPAEEDVAMMQRLESRMEGDDQMEIYGLSMVFMWFSMGFIEGLWMMDMMDMMDMDKLQMEAWKNQNHGRR